MAMALSIVIATFRNVWELRLCPAPAPIPRHGCGGILDCDAGIACIASRGPLAGIPLTSPNLVMVSSLLFAL